MAKLHSWQCWNEVVYFTRQTKRNNTGNLKRASQLFLIPTENRLILVKQRFPQRKEEKKNDIWQYEGKRNDYKAIVLNFMNKYRKWRTFEITLQFIETTYERSQVIARAPFLDECGLCQPRRFIRYCFAIVNIIWQKVSKLIRGMRQGKNAMATRNDVIPKLKCASTHQFT